MEANLKVASTCDIFQQYPFPNNDGIETSKGVWIQCNVCWGRCAVWENALIGMRATGQPQMQISDLQSKDFFLLWWDFEKRRGEGRGG